MATYAIPVTTVGAAGSATGTTTLGFVTKGLIDMVKVDYHASAPATTVVVLSESGGSGQTVLTAPASATDATFYPQRQNHTPAGAAIAADYDRFFITGKLLVTVTLSDALTNAVIVTVNVIEEDKAVF